MKREIMKAAFTDQTQSVPKPVIGFPMTTFKETVAMNLEELEGSIFL